MNLEKRTGVIVGRFQVPRLTSGHKKFIDYVVSKNERVIIVVGSCQAKLDLRDPLPYNVVYSMLNDYIVTKHTHKHDNVVIRKISDHPSNEYWVSELERIVSVEAPAEDVICYGGRGSFLSVYRQHGSYTVEFYESGDLSSGTEIRGNIQNQSISDIKDNLIESSYNLSESFRTGIIYASSLLYPTSYQCVDIIAHTENNHIVLIKKQGADVWQLPGGFVDVKDSTLEEAAIRELKEETNLIAENVSYCFSSRIDDYRYRNRRDKIMTSLFETKIYAKELLYVKALDDAFEIRAVLLSDVMIGCVCVLKSHLEMLIKWGENNKR